MFENCERIRGTAELIISVSLHDWSQRDILHLLGYVYARIKREAIEHDEEKEFVKYWDKLVKHELEDINHANPIEPKEFDNSYDFRKDIKS
jgi:hypothetical protein